MAKNTDVIDVQSLVASFSLCGEKLETKFDSINDIEYIVGTQTATTGSWTGKTKSTALYAGKTIIYKLPYSSSGNVSLNLTFPDGSKSGAKAVYRWASTRLTTQYGANYYVPLVFNGTYWFAFADYDTNYYDRLRIPNAIAIADGAIKSACLVGTLDGTHYKELKNESTFDLRYPYFYNSSSINDGANLSTSLYIISGSLNLRTFFNDDNKTVTFPKLLYLKGTLAGNIFTVHSDIIVEEPTTPDDYIYIRIGSSYSAYQMYLNLVDIRIYKWVNGSFQAFDNKALRAVEDYQGQQIDSTYIKNISTNTEGLTLTKGNNTTQSISLSLGNTTLDTVPSIVNGGMWFEVEDDTPIIKFKYNTNIYSITMTQDPKDPELTLTVNGNQITVSYLGTGTVTVSTSTYGCEATYNSSTRVAEINYVAIDPIGNNDLIGDCTVTLSTSPGYLGDTKTVNNIVVIPGSVFIDDPGVATIGSVQLYTSLGYLTNPVESVTVDGELYEFTISLTTIAEQETFTIYGYQEPSGELQEGGLELFAPEFDDPDQTDAYITVSDMLSSYLNGNGEFVIDDTQLFIEEFANAVTEANSMVEGSYNFAMFRTENFNIKVYFS